MVSVAWKPIHRKVREGWGHPLSGWVEEIKSKIWATGRSRPTSRQSKIGARYERDTYKDLRHTFRSRSDTDAGNRAKPNQPAQPRRLSQVDSQPRGRRGDLRIADRAILTG